MVVFVLAAVGQMARLRFDVTCFRCFTLDAAVDLRECLGLFIDTIGLLVKSPLSVFLVAIVRLVFCDRSSHPK